MRIGIIGAGQIGGTLARRLAKLGHSVSIANSRGPTSLATLAVETGAKPVSVADAVKGADLVVVTIPEKSVPLLPKDLFRDVPAEVIVVDTGTLRALTREGGRPQPSSCSSHFDGARRQRSSTFSADDGWELAADVGELPPDVKELPSSRCVPAADRRERAEVVKVLFAARSVKVGVAKKLADDGCRLGADGGVSVMRRVRARILDM
jgi:hypothetical protein